MNLSGARADEITFTVPVQRQATYRAKKNTSSFAEEEGTVWLWALPKLLGWPHPIRWLFSPVNGSRVDGKRTTGDLWGIDDAGTLVILEAKRAANETDPFGEFVEHGLPTRDLARSQWRRFLQVERDFANDHGAALLAGTLPKGTYPGIVPYSVGRDRVERWANLYLSHIGPVVLTPAAEQATEAALARHTGETHVVGLFVVDGEEVPRLSGAGIGAMDGLRSDLGRERVHVRAVAYEPVAGGTRFSGWTPDLAAREPK